MVWIRGSVRARWCRQMPGWSAEPARPVSITRVTREMRGYFPEPGLPGFDCENYVFGKFRTRVASLERGMADRIERLFSSGDIVADARREFCKDSSQMIDSIDNSRRKLLPSREDGDRWPTVIRATPRVQGAKYLARLPQLWGRPRSARRQHIPSRLSRSSLPVVRTS
jgi:hypothetical protein